MARISSGSEEGAGAERCWEPAAAGPEEGGMARWEPSESRLLEPFAAGRRCLGVDDGVTRTVEWISPRRFPTGVAGAAAVAGVALLLMIVNCHAVPSKRE